MVFFDASVLIDLFQARLGGERRLRVDHLIKTLELQKQSIVIPAPAYTEFLIGAKGARGEYHTRIEQSSSMRVEPYSNRAAMECAILLSEAFDAGQKAKVSRTKFKFDWMIFAMAKALGADRIYTGDADIMRISKRASVEAMHLDDLPLPPAPPQLPLELVGGA